MMEYGGMVIKNTPYLLCQEILMNTSVCVLKSPKNDPNWRSTERQSSSRTVHADVNRDETVMWWWKVDLTKRWVWPHTTNLVIHLLFIHSLLSIFPPPNFSSESEAYRNFGHIAGINGMLGHCNSPYTHTLTHTLTFTPRGGLEFQSWMFLKDKKNTRTQNKKPYPFSTTNRKWVSFWLVHQNLTCREHFDQK